ncbi:MAG: hypothetical protein E6R08_10175 [Nevskiaceae bacterium]|nr:MAG: hypothetical protein E6R08_10175 [Nevskiaceae bacterium]
MSMTIQTEVPGRFVSFEIAPVALLADGSVEAFESERDARQRAGQEGTTPLWGVYGRYANGISEHLADRKEEGDALALIFALSGRVPPGAGVRQTVVVAAATVEIESLARTLELAGASESTLDEMVHDVASGEASDANNSGLPGQVAFLLARGLGPRDILMAGGVRVC